MTIAVPDTDRIHAGAAVDHFTTSSRVADAFFSQRADDIANACADMAACFERGGRLFVCGDGAQRSDVAHVVVEFVHPVVVGKRALPAFALPEIEYGAAARALHVLSRRGDILLLLASASLSSSALDVLSAARDQEMMTIALAGESETRPPGIDHLFAIASADACIVQETQEMLYHILWELVHVFLDHRTASAAHV